MRFLLDTHLLLWAANGTNEGGRALPTQVLEMIEDVANEPVFSVASLWEVAIKNALGRRDFAFDPRLLRRGLLDNGYVELVIAGNHATAVAGLPPLHRDPFDRILIAQAMVEGMPLFTVDRTFARYPGPIKIF